MTNINFKVKTEEESSTFGRFIIEPLDQGYGHTLGNALRRVLLTSLSGAAITSVKVEGVKHQFSTLAGLKEDMVEFILNLKKVRLQIFDQSPVTMTLSIRGGKEIHASDIKTGAGAEIINKDLYLGTLSDKATLEVELTAEKGFGYSLSDERKTNTIGVMVIDALFSPVVRVNYKVEATRVGRMTNLDKLVIEITTDGTISSAEALKEAGKVLVSYFMQIYEPRVVPEDTNVAVTPQISDEILKMTVEELDLPTRITNSLRNGGIETVGQLLGTPRKDLLKIKNLGAKSLSAVEEKLREKGVALSV